jgi:hypothetical protein
MLFRGSDAGSVFTALTLDMSEAGAATFSGTVTATQFSSTSSNASLPSFGVSAGNGMYNAGTNVLGFSTNSLNRMTLDASGNLGLGVVPNAWATSVYKAIQLGASNGVGLIAARVDAVNEVSFGLNWYYDGGTNAEYTASSYATNYAQGNGAHRWQTAASGTAGDNITWTDAMTLDASGNLLVGKTTTAFGTAGIEALAGGTLWATASATNAASFNRLSTDGPIAYFSKDGTAVGSIGSRSGVVSYIVLDPRSGVKGAALIGGSVDANNGIINPGKADGDIADDAISLGGSSSRFKDLYLSGGVYLGGTGAANLLDDYEEGLPPQ